MSTTALFFDYQSNSKIKIKKENCYVSEDYPLMFGIVTKKLVFMVPKAASILTQKHVYIPNSVYQQALITYYTNYKK